MVGFVVAVVVVGIGVRLGYSGGWQWLAVYGLCRRLRKIERQWEREIEGELEIIIITNE